MKTDSKAAVIGCIALIPVLIVSWILRGWAPVTLWGWFITPVFHQPAPSAAIAIGIGILGSMLCGEQGHSSSSSSPKDGESAAAKMVNAFHPCGRWKMSVIVGLDLSLTGTGMCRVEGEQVQWKVAGTAPQDKKARTRYPDDVWEAMRLGKLLGAISEFTAGASFVCLEDFAKMSGAGGGGARIGLAYLIRYWLWKNGIPFVVVAPMTLKKFVCGKASKKGADGTMQSAPKEVIMREVYRLWGHMVDDNNAADAISLAYIGMGLKGMYDPAETQNAAAPVRHAQASVIADLKKKNPEVAV